MLRVVVSMDDKSVISAFLDRNATINYNKGNRAYFTGRYADMEDRDGTERPLR